ncbi:hypothetical protein [Caulobacter sp. NIBR1757]|uniref:hypothetical protein n=1 Tax=Caulobacter sp. NIBR1757 TaxID=3016000 RepID=UPI0022F09A23|nr:hypothetical protein [Caulobacter sp. NIBR1757]WGM40224.1 hypothetical protein AMEJIAPC_03165 [Caulobacter sp. NIBR1757]
MIRPPLIILGGAAVLAAVISFWPAKEPDMTAAGLLPASGGPRIAAAGVEEPSSAARMTRFAGAGAPISAEAAAAPDAAPPPPRPDALPVLVGVMGKDGALTGYFSSNGLSVRARRGDSVDGWRVVSLGRRDARLVKGRKRLQVALFTARGGPLSPAMAAPERRMVAVAPAAGIGGAVTAPASPAGPPRPPRVRRPLPPPPAGSKGWWSGPPGEEPPAGYTRVPRVSD